MISLSFSIKHSLLSLWENSVDSVYVWRREIGVTVLFRYKDCLLCCFFVSRVYHYYSQHDYANIRNCRRFTNVFIAFTIYCFGNNLLYSTNIRHYLISITINMSKLKGILLKYITLSLMTMSDFNTQHLWHCYLHLYLNIQIIFWRVP